MRVNTKIHAFGTICKRGHEYKNTGFGLRYKKSRKCKECTRLLKLKPNWTESQRQNHREYLSKWRNNDKYRSEKRKYSQTRRDCLTDEYISWGLKRAFGLVKSQIGKEVIGLKRSQLLLFREIKKTKEVLNGTY